MPQRDNMTTSDRTRAGGWGKNDELLTDEQVFGGWGAGDTLLSDDDVFGRDARRDLPADVKPNESAGAGRGGIVERPGERQAFEAQQRARKGTTRGVLAYAAGDPIDRQALRFEPSQAGAGRGSIVQQPGERAAYTSGSQQYRDKREAIDDAVDRIALGVPADNVFDQFAAIGVSRDEIVARGIELDDPRFAADARPVTVRSGAQDGGMAGVEPTTTEGITNFGKRVAARGSQALTGAAATAGIIGPDATARLLARDERKAQAAVVVTELQRELEALGQVKEWDQVPGAISSNLRGTAVLLAESLALSAPALATTLMGLPRVAMATGVGVSSGSLEYGSALSDALGDRGITLLDVDRVAAALRDPKFVADVRERGAKRGLTIGLIDAFTAGMAGKFVEPALAAARAGKVAGAAAVRQVAAGVAKEIGVQMAGGAGGEALGQKLTGDNKPLDIALEALAEGVSAPMEARSNLAELRQAQRTAPQQGVLASAADSTVTPLRAEDMKTTPVTPDEVVALTQASQQQRAAQEAARQAAAPAAADAAGNGQIDAQRADGGPVAPTPSLSAQQRQALGLPPGVDQRRVTGQTNQAGADRQQRPADEAAAGNERRAPTPAPGQIARGSIADEARRTLEARQAATDAPTSVVGESSAARVAEQTANPQPASSKASPPASSNATTAPAVTPSSQAGTRGGKTEPEQRQQAVDMSFPSRDAALVSAVQAGQWQRQEPAQGADGRWRLQDRQQAAADTPSTPPSAARTGANAAGQQSPTATTAPVAPTTAPPTAAQGGVQAPVTATTAPQQQASQNLAETAKATHADPGKAPEPATAAVAAGSVAKAAAATDRKPSELRADLVTQIDAALARAPDEDLPTWKRPSRERLRQAMVDMKLGSLERAEQALRSAHDNRVADAASRIGFIEFDVPGDGSFRVMNSANRLTEFKRLVEKSAGFKAAGRPGTAPEPDGAQRGSPSTKAAIESMVDDNDPQAAVDYATAKGVDIAEIGLSPSRLAKVAGLEPTAMRDETGRADGQTDRIAETDAGPASESSTAADLAPDAPAAPPSATPAADAADLAVRPAEMTQAEFLASVTFERAGNAANPWVARWKGVDLEADAAGFDHPDLGKTVVAGARLHPTRKQAVAAAKSAHRRAVKRALQRGEPVPEAVRAEYPDLVPPAPTGETGPGGAAATAMPDTLGIDRDRLADRQVTYQVTIAETGQTATVEIDADKLLADIEDTAAKAEASRLTGADSALFSERLAGYLGDGVDPAAARQRAITDVLDDLRTRHTEAEQLIREQHPDLFLAGSGANAAAARAERLGDAGEKIGGARKDRWRERGMSLADLDDMTEAEGAELVTKANAWKPDYEAMVAAGNHPVAVAMVKTVYDSLAAQPKDNTPAGRRRYVSAMQAVREVYGNLGQLGDGLAGKESTARTAMQRAAEALREKLGIYGKDMDALQEAKRVLFSVYKGRSDPFSPSYSIEQRSRRLVADGFPAKAEPWTRRFEVRPAGGSGLTDAGVAVHMAKARELASGLTDEQIRAGFYTVLLKGTRMVKAMGATRDDAMAAARAVYERERQVETDSKATPDRPHLDVLQRDGLPTRIERDAKPDDLVQTFGFRGIEFGNWTANDERQRMVNMAFDGVNDLADILGVPPAALSLNGTLGLAFGARGGGRFAAHYEPGKLVINLTKLQGGGSLAHEWAHALDHYVGELDQADAYTTAARGASGWYTKRDYSGRAERRMVQEGGRWVSRVQQPLGNLRPELAAAVDTVMRALHQQQIGKAEMVRELELTLERTQARAAEATDPELRASFDRAVESQQKNLDEARAEPEGKTYSRGESSFLKQARMLSGKSVNGYWQRPTELFARAFESYVFDRLAAMGAKSEYLVHGVESDRFAGGNYKGNPYPTGDERAAINRAFDAMFATFKTRQTDKGVALFQRKTRGGGRTGVDSTAERNALRALSQNDELFALPRSGGRTVAEIAADIAPQVKVRTTVVSSQETMHRLTMPDSSFALVIERKANPFGPGVFGYETVGGAEVPITTRPGDNPEDVDPGVADVYIDASNLKPGGAGAQVYGIAAALAHNTDAIFIGDPAGLSDEALRRRSEQMLSSALKYGTTRHLAPHPRQLRGDASLGVPPLRWVYGDDLGNIRRLVDANLAALENAGLDDITFDPASGHFTDTAGQEIGRSGIGARVAAGVGRGALAGRTTLARGAVLRALVREEGAALEGPDGRRDGLLARLAGLADHDDLAGVFYDRSGARPDPVADPDRVRLVRAAVEQITAGWANAPEIEVLASMQDAPDPVRRANIRQLAAGAQGQPAAFYFGGKVYVLASQMNTQRDVAEAVAHEALGHFGLRGTFGPELGAVLDELAVMREVDVRAKAAEYGLNFDNAAQRQQAAEEVLAELAQTEPELGLVKRAIAAIRNWLRQNIPALADLEMTDAEVVARFILPARAFVVDGAAGRQAGGAAAFARKDGGSASAAGFKAWMDQTGGDASGVRFTDSGAGARRDASQASTVRPSLPLPATIEVDGQQRPTRDSQGNQIAGDEDAVRDFWQQFAGSTMVDSAGRPLVLNVGTEKGRARITPRSKGEFGAGVYLREAKDAARSDVPMATTMGAFEAKPAYAVLKRPYVLKGASRTLPASFTAFGAPKIDSAAGSLIEAIMSPTSQAQMFAHMWRGKAEFGEVFKRRLTELGFDGLVVRFADAADGQPLVVAFNSNQVLQAEVPGKAPDAANDAAPIDNAGRGLPETVEIEGRQRPTRNASGQTIHPTEEGVRAFWQWFGDSREVDKQGRPLVLFHGTQADFSEFRPSPLGFYGPGIYMTTSPRDASTYAENGDNDDGGGAQVLPIYAAMRNPYRYTSRWEYLPKWFKAPADFDPADLSILSAAPKLIEDVMPRAEAQRLIEQMLAGEQIGDALTKRLQELGHDGLIVTDDGPDGDGGNEHIAFEASQVKSAIGNAGTFGGDTGDIRFQRRVDPAQQPARDFALRPFGRVGRGIEVMQDRFNRWKQAIDDVRRQGGSITDANDFYRAEERYWGQVGAGIEDFKDELTTFVKAVNADGLTIDDVALYAYAQHAEERNELIARRRPDMPDGGSGMSTDEADDILQAARDAGVEAELQRHAATLRQWIQGTREVLLQGGLIDQDQHDTWAGMFQQYVPLRGVEDADAAGEGRVAPGRQARRRGGIRGDEAEHAEGRQARALQIVEQIAADRARALVRVGRNEVLRAFARFVLDNPSPSLWEINAVERRRTATVDEDGYRTVTESDEVIKDGRTITLKDNGEEVHILVKDAKLLEQLQRLGLDEHPAWAVGALLSANRWLSRVYTSLSPVFTAINALRDTQAAAIGMIDEIGFMGAPKLFAALPRAWADSFKAEAGRPSADYAVFKALGGVTHFHNLTTIDQQAKELEAIVADAERMSIDPRKFLPKAMALIESLNGGIENATRLAAFNVARQSGMSAVQAASVAKNITVNFNRRGTQQLANAWVLFFNPAVQGTARLAQAMTNPKVQAAVGTAMLGVAALALRNASMGDDDDGVAWWDKIPDEVKERNLVIVLPPGSTAGEAVPKSKTGRYIKVPMPYGYNFFAVVANQMVDVWRNSQDAKRGRDLVRGGAKAFSAFASSWLPAADLGRAVSADDAESAGKSAVLLMVPDALDPLARIGINQDSFGRPMRPDSRFSSSLPDSAGYFSGQHGTMFQRGAAALNEATGGSRFRSGGVDVAPATMEHLARSYGGGPVSFGLDILNALYVRQSIARPELDGKRLPFAKQFYGVIDAETDRMTGYQRLEKAEKIVDPIKRAMNAGDAEEAIAMRDEAGQLAGLGDAVLLTRQNLSQIVKNERTVIDSTTMSDSGKYVKLLELAERRRAVLQRFNAVYDKAVDATVKQEEGR